MITPFLAYFIKVNIALGLFSPSTGFFSEVTPSFNGATSVKEYRTDTERQRDLFAACLYTTQYLDQQAPRKTALFFLQRLFRSLYEDLFFRAEAE